MDDKTRIELYKRANGKLEATMDTIRNAYESLNEIHSNLYTIFCLLHIANRDIEKAVTIDVE